MHDANAMLDASEEVDHQVLCTVYESSGYHRNRKEMESENRLESTQCAEI
jgi:hypothetical protein